jgi:transcriptional regulator with XRE-family HTH domain
MQHFGDKLRTLRTYHNITLKQLANFLGYTTHSYLSELESGQKLPTTKLVLQLSYLFNVTTDELLKDELQLNLENSKMESNG